MNDKDTRLKQIQSISKRTNDFIYNITDGSFEYRSIIIN